MAAVEDNFKYWLSLKLKELNMDESVYSSYIISILETEDPEEETREALEGILSEISPEDISSQCQEIIEKWLLSNNKVSSNIASKPMEHLENVDERLARLLETNVKANSVQRSYTEEERKIREAILSQYGQTSDYEDNYDEINGEDENKGKHKSKENGLEKNMNALAIHQAEKEKRERLKEESKKKKEKDKEDKEKQKQSIQEKKEKRKASAQKGERRR